MKRSAIYQLTPLERKQFLERIKWKRERKGIKLIETCNEVYISLK